MLKTRGSTSCTRRITASHSVVVLVPLFFLFSGCITTKPRSHRPSSSAVVLPGIPVRAWGDNTCGAGALSTVLNYFQNPATEDQLNATLKKGRHGGVVSVDLLLEARKHGFDARLVKGTPEMVEEALRDGSPPILMLRVLDTPGQTGDLFHYIVVDGYDPQRELVRMQFGDGIVRWASLETSSRVPVGGGVEKAWAGTDYATLIVERKDPRRDDQGELRRAVLLEESGRLEDARSAYRDYLKAHEQSSVGWTNLGNVEAQLGNYKEAETAYQRAISIDGQNRDALNNLAWVLLQLKRLDEAETIAREAVSLGGPDPHLILDTLGQIQLARGQCAAAAETYERAIAAAPSSPAAPRAPLLFGLGAAQVRCGNAAAARSALQSALGSSPDALTERQIRELLATLP